MLQKLSWIVGCLLHRQKRVITTHEVMPEAYSMSLIDSLGNHQDMSGASRFTVEIAGHDDRNLRTERTSMDGPR